MDLLVRPSKKRMAKDHSFVYGFFNKQYVSQAYLFRIFVSMGLDFNILNNGTMYIILYLIIYRIGYKKIRNWLENIKIKIFQLFSYAMLSRLFRLLSPKTLQKLPFWFLIIFPPSPTPLSHLFLATAPHFCQSDPISLPWNQYGTGNLVSTRALALLNGN